LPAPSQREGGVSAGEGGPPSSQLPALQTVVSGYSAHWPAAHMPVVPQVLCAVVAQIPCGSAPLCTSVQVPVDAGRLQAVHAPVQALSQHLPCAQCVLAHSLSLEQSAPRGLGPHELMFPFWPQLFGGMHCSLLVQAP